VGGGGVGGSGSGVNSCSIKTPSISIGSLIVTYTTASSIASYIS